MIFSPTANMLAKALEESDLTQREVADRVGFRNANIVSMMKTGETRVPLDRIPALAQTLGMDEQDFLILAIQEYHPVSMKFWSRCLGCRYQTQNSAF